jgi:hypothetical protein
MKKDIRKEPKIKKIYGTQMAMNQALLCGL